MHVGTYRFAGDPAELLAAYDRMMAQFDSERFDLHVCAVGTDAVTVVDACPDEATFRVFSAGVDWNGAGLPTPTVTHLGEIHAAHIGPTVGR